MAAVNSGCWEWFGYPVRALCRWFPVQQSSEQRPLIPRYGRDPDPRFCHDSAIHPLEGIFFRLFRQGRIARISSIPGLFMKACSPILLARYDQVWQNRTSGGGSSSSSSVEKTGINKMRAFRLLTHKTHVSRHIPATVPTEGKHMVPDTRCRKFRTSFPTPSHPPIPTPIFEE